MAELLLGLIGCGALGHVHAGCVAELRRRGQGPAARFLGYADIVEAAAQRAREAFSAGDADAYATTQVERLLADERIGAVYICTRHDSHARLAVAAARAGKHILIEKPLALTEEECRAVAEAVASAGVALMPAFKMRYYPLVRRAREFVAQPFVLVGQMMDNRWPDEAWAQDPVQGGANVHSQGCHTTDLLRYLAGAEPTRVWAAGGTYTHPGHPCLDQCAATIQFANGAVAAWVQGDAAMGQFSSKFFFELFGQGRSVQLHDRLKRATFFDGASTWAEERADEEGFLLENKEFLTALADGRAPALNAQDGLQATRMVLAAERAIRTGEVQEL